MLSGQKKAVAQREAGPVWSAGKPATVNTVFKGRRFKIGLDTRRPNVHFDRQYRFPYRRCRASRPVMSE